jgi:transposase InsO family protein
MRGSSVRHRHLKIRGCFVGVAQGFDQRIFIRYVARCGFRFHRLLCELRFWIGVRSGLLAQHQIKISMDGKGCWRDNVFVERIWKSVKYEEVYLHAYESVTQARQALTRYFSFYNTRRPHSSLDGQTPDTVYFNSLPQQLAA